jgi:hypothetical protein
MKLLFSFVYPPTVKAQGKSSSARLPVVGSNAVPKPALVVVVVNAYSAYILQLGMKRFNLHDVISLENFPGEEEVFVPPTIDYDARSSRKLQT